MEILQLDKTNKEAYQHLISIYDEMGDYDSILSLKEDVTDENILALFDDYEVGEPIISPLSGQYDDYITVVIYSIAEMTFIIRRMALFRIKKMGFHIHREVFR